ncbi:MAG: PIG-L family deacetylase [Anaerolineaceae bacterium]
MPGNVLNVLAFFAHPDDETMLCGGTLALLAAAGARVHYLIATRGEGGEVGDPPLCTQAELGKVRAAEMKCAVQALGGVSLDFLDYVDPMVGADNTLFPFEAELEQVVDALSHFLRYLQVDAIITHGANGEYGHPAHRLVNQAASAAVNASAAQARLLYHVQAAFENHPRPHLMNKDEPAHLVLETAAVKDAKTAAALCHRSQHALFVRRASERAGRALTVAVVITTLESLHRAYPPVDGALQDDLARLLQGTGAVIAA